MPVVTGTAYWASVKQPNTTFDPAYQINLVVDEETAEDFESRGFKLKELEAGRSLLFKRKIDGPNGMVRQAPKLFDASKTEIDLLIGNGSKVRVQYKEWSSSFKGKDFQGLDLMAVQVLDLVTYDPDKPGDEFDVETADSPFAEDEL